MKKIVVLLFLVLSVNLFAVGASENTKDTNDKGADSSKEPMKLAFGGFENGKLSENAVILFIFENGNIRYILTVERADGEKIVKDGEVYKFPRDKELVTKAIIENKGGELKSYKIGFAFGSENFRDTLGITKATIETPDGSIKEYNLSDIFASDGSFIPEIELSVLKNGKTTIKMFSIKDAAKKEGVKK